MSDDTVAGEAKDLSAIEQALELLLQARNMSKPGPETIRDMVEMGRKR